MHTQNRKKNNYQSMNLFRLVCVYVLKMKKVVQNVIEQLIFRSRVILFLVHQQKTALTVLGLV